MSREISYDNPYEDKCPIVYAMSIIGSKWKIPILWNLAHHGPLRYGELKRHLRGISGTVLTRCLHELESDRLVVRGMGDSDTTSTMYGLTAEGEELIPALDGLYCWGEAHRACSRNTMASDRRFV